MEGNTDRLTESVIGLQVLGRPKDFAPLEDSSVRTRAYELRHRLEKLYSLESPDQEIRIVLPKGSYVPGYERHAVAPAPMPAASAGMAEPSPDPIAAGPAVLHPVASGYGGEDSPSSPAAGGFRQRAFTLLAGIALGLGLAATVFLNLPVREKELDPLLREAWGPIASADSDILLCVATPLHLVVGPSEHRVQEKPWYPAPPEAYPLFRQTRPLNTGEKLGLLLTGNAIGFGNMIAVNAIVTRLKELGLQYQLFPEHVAPSPIFRERHVILFGAPVDSAAITRVLENTPITVDFDPPAHEFVIRFRDTGKILVPTRDAKGEFTVVYGLVTVRNDRRSARGNLGMMVFSGITSTGTHGAAEYFSNPESLRELRDRFRADHVEGFPPAYQVVVKCHFGNQMLLSYEAIDHRILETR